MRRHHPAPRRAAGGAMSRRRFLGGAGLAAAGLCLPCRGDEKRADPAPHEARWYSPLDGKTVRCELCPRQCVVPDGGRGHCDVRENRGGRYVSLVYGRPVSIHVDPIEKKPFLHVYPGTRAYSLATVGCNIDCKFCQNWEISQAKPADIPAPYRSPEDIARAAKESGARTIAFTYTEPTVFCEYAIDCARAGRALGIDSVVVSNGFIAPKAQEDLLAQVKAYKVDLKAFTQDFYERMCGGQLAPVKESLRRIAKSGVWLEIVNLLIPTLNDNPDDLKRMAGWVVKELGPDVPLIFTAYHPAYKIRNIPPTPARTLERACEIARAEGCRFTYGGNIPGMKSSDTYCPKCKATVVERYGYTILKNGNGKCPGCGAAIPGVWL